MSGGHPFGAVTCLEDQYLGPLVIGHCKMMYSGSSNSLSYLL